MKIACLSFFILLSAFANQELTLKDYQQKLEETTNEIETVIAKDIGTESTCVDEYLQREKQLRRWLIWAPPITVVALPTALVVGGFTGGVLANAFAVADGWAALGYSIGGMMLGTGGVALSFIGIETVSAIRFINNRKMIHLIVEAQNDNLEGKTLNKYFRKLHKKYNQDLNIAEFAQWVRDLDTQGMLCDGSLKKKKKGNKLKHLLASKKDLFHFLSTPAENTMKI